MLEVSPDDAPAAHRDPGTGTIVAEAHLHRVRAVGEVDRTERVTGLARLPDPMSAERFTAKIVRRRARRARVTKPGALSGECVWPDSQALAFRWHASSARSSPSGLA